ncbi:MAG: hypothetical protein JXX14_18775 [Deltaproteobacteria bacterium]|nr:hypothetical protein [Deltaproteobacteria bacterium]
MQIHTKNQNRQARQAVADILAETLLNMVMAKKAAAESENAGSNFKQNPTEPDSLPCH